MEACLSGLKGAIYNRLSRARTRFRGSESHRLGTTVLEDDVTIDIWHLGSGLAKSVTSELETGCLQGTTEFPTFALSERESMKSKRLRFTLHLLGREIFSLSIEWIKTKLWGGSELATPRPTGKVCNHHYVTASDFLPIADNLLLSRFCQEGIGCGEGL